MEDAAESAEEAAERAERADASIMFGMCSFHAQLMTPLSLLVNMLHGARGLEVASSSCWVPKPMRCCMEDYQWTMKM